MAKETLTEQEASLLELLVWLSRTCICQATNETLRSFLKCSESTLKRLLASLERKGRIIRVTTAAEVRAGQIVRKRYIQLVSSRDAGTGARLVATFVRERTKGLPDIHPDFETVVHYGHVLGPLRCTLQQLREWLSVAVERRYLILKPVGGVSMYVLGGQPYTPAYQPKVKEWEAPESVPLLRDRIASYIRSRNGNPCTVKQLADALGYGATQIRNEARQVNGLYEWKDRSRTFFGFSPSGNIEGLTARASRVVRLLQEQGPLTTDQLKKWVCDLTGIFKEVSEIGIEQTRFGNARVWSLGPLPREYRAAVREQQKQRKSFTNQEYYEKRVPAVPPADLHETILESAFNLVARQHHVYRVPALYPKFQALCTPEAIRELYDQLRAEGVARGDIQNRIRGVIIDRYIEVLKQRAQQDTVQVIAA